MQIADAVKIATRVQAWGDPAQWYRYLFDARQATFHDCRVQDEQAFAHCRWVSDRTDVSGGVKRIALAFQGTVISDILRAGVNPCE